jgi:hypothetical protein
LLKRKTMAASRLSGIAVVAAATLLAACRHGGIGGPCGPDYVAGTYTDPGPWGSEGGWYDAAGSDPSADDGTDTGDPGSSDMGSTNDMGSTGDPGSSDPGTDGDPGSDGSGDDSSDALRRPRLATRTAPSSPPDNGIVADANGCYACEVTCVLAAAAASQPNAATANGGSRATYQRACDAAQSELADWARSQGTHLIACRIGGTVQTAAPERAPQLTVRGMGVHPLAGWVPLESPSPTR